MLANDATSKELKKYIIGVVCPIISSNMRYPKWKTNRRNVGKWCIVPKCFVFQFCDVLEVAIIHKTI
jgi:hypothetical protein